MFTIHAPFSARLMSLREVPDPVFSAAIVGPGFGLDPRQQPAPVPKNGHLPERIQVLSPCGGSIIRLMGHALVIRSPGFAWPLLLHLGIDTVQAGREYMECLVQLDQTVKTGQPLFTWKLEQMVLADLDPTTVIAALQCPDPHIFEPVIPRVVSSGEKLFTPSPA